MIEMRLENKAQINALRLEKSKSLTHHSQHLLKATSL